MNCMKFIHDEKGIGRKNNYNNIHFFFYIKLYEKENICFFFFM
jgi:hypothetical protein